MKESWKKSIQEMGDEIFDMLMTWALIGAGIVYLVLVILTWLNGGGT